MGRRVKGQPRESTLERRTRQYLGKLHREGKVFFFNGKGPRYNQGGVKATPNRYQPLYHGSGFVGYVL